MRLKRPSWILVHTRSRPGHCFWKCYTVRGLPWHLAIPASKWIYTFEPWWRWVYVARTPNWKKAPPMFPKLKSKS